MNSAVFHCPTGVEPCNDECCDVDKEDGHCQAFKVHVSLNEDNCSPSDYIHLFNV